VSEVFSVAMASPSSLNKKGEARQLRRVI
jgi:hypothetical protein